VLVLRQVDLYLLHYYRITNEFTARITSDATLSSTDVDKTANTPSIKAYIDNSSEYTGYTGTVLFERRLYDS
jgi:hypothetical protein